jgi:predicted molibdopterin-dependent oxidoreductase YjgC
MGSNNIDRTMTDNQAAVDRALRDSFGWAASTNSNQEMFTSTGCALVVGPSIVDKAPVGSYWINWARMYREAKTVVISRDHFPMCDRAEVWIRPPAGSELAVIGAIARIILDENLANTEQAPAGLDDWISSLHEIDPRQVAEATGVPLVALRRAALLYATGGKEALAGQQDAAYGASAIYHTLSSEPDGDVYGPAVALNNLALLTGNIGRAGGGVIAFRGPNNFQGATDMGCYPAYGPGYRSLDDASVRQQFESAWLPRWDDATVPHNGFKSLRSLPSEPGLALDGIINAIEAGTIKAMYVATSSHPGNYGQNDRLIAALRNLEFLVVEDTFPGPLSEIAHVVLPATMFMEDDGTFTNADRTIQRVRFVLSGPGETKPGWWYVQEIAQRLGYNLNHRHPSFMLEEIAQIAPIYRGASFPRLERGPMQWPVQAFGSKQTVYLSFDGDLAPGTVRFIAD